MRKYDRTGRHVHTESSLGASIDYSHDKDGNLSEMNSGGWSARWQRDRVGLETERELTGGVHVRTHHDSLGRETYKSVGARNVEQFRRSYTWGIGNRLHATEDGLTGRRVRYDYDEFDNLLSAEYKQGNDVERIYRIPDRIGNLFETREKDDRKYGTGSRLTEDRDYFYHYDCEGNLVFKEFRTLDWAGMSVPLGVQKAHLEEELGITFRAFGAGWRYDWQSDGILSRVVRPDGKEVSFAYDALGRRTEKTYEDVATHFVWDGNVPLHEWQEGSSDAEKTNITTWLFEQNTFIPAAKLAANGESFSIVSDYLGTPLQAFDNNGNKVWEQELDIFGRKRRKNNNNSSFIPFKYQGQYEDVETGLYYNRFRYYEPNTGTYISQDPIGLAGNNPTLYGYVNDINTHLDVLGLTIIPTVTRGANKEVLTAEATIKRSDLGTGTNTNAASRKYARSLGNADDDAGHMIGKQLGGSGGKKNVFPQDFHVNRGEFAQFEGRVVDFVDLHGQADIQIKFQYKNGGTRPTKITYTATAPDKSRIKKTFKNTH